MNPSLSCPREHTAKKKYPSDFIFGKAIGEGSFATVYLGKDIITNKEYAIKVCDKNHILKEKKVDHIWREKNILLKLSKKQFIVTLFTTFQDRDSLYFVLSYAKNGQLFEAIQKVGAFNLNACRFYAAEILLALETLHNMNIVHRDLKPENILLDENLHIMLSDFGSAKILIEPETGNPKDIANARRSSFVGTAQYVCPELLNEKTFSPASDLWAYGCVAYQMAFGYPPFEGKSEYFIFQRIINLEYEFEKGCDELVKSFVESFLVLDPAKRLGMADKKRYESIRNHIFFEGVNFNTLAISRPPSTSESRLEAKNDYRVLDDLGPGIKIKQLSRLLELTVNILDKPSINNEANSHIIRDIAQKICECSLPRDTSENESKMPRNVPLSECKKALETLQLACNHMSPHTGKVQNITNILPQMLQVENNTTLKTSPLTSILEQKELQIEDTPGPKTFQAENNSGPKISHTENASSSKMLQTENTSGPRQSPTQITSSLKMLQTENTSSPKPSQTQTTSISKTLQIENTSSPKPSQTENTSSPQPSQTQNSSSSKTLQIKNTSSPKPSQTENTSNPKPSQTPNTSSPKTLQIKNTSSPKPSQTENTLGPKALKTENTSGSKTSPSENTSAPNTSQMEGSSSSEKSQSIGPKRKKRSKWDPSPAEIKRRLEKQRKENEYDCLVQGHLILKQGLVDKKKGFFARRRMLLMTTGPRLFYADPSDVVLKGEIPWGPELRVEAKNFKVFYVHTENRTYYLEDFTGYALEWCKAIEELHSIAYNIEPKDPIKNKYYC